MKTTVYRIQDGAGRGPFRPGMTAKWLDEERESLPEAPIADQVKIKKAADPSFNLAFACRSIDDLRKWISATEYARLKKLCYYACAIDVDETWDLENQVIAGRKRAYRHGFRIVKLY